VRDSSLGPDHITTAPLSSKDGAGQAVDRIQETDNYEM